MTSTLFADNPTAEYADYADRALWNHILASQSPQAGLVCYFVPLRAGGKKLFQNPEAFTCCTGSGMENHARYGEYIYAHLADTLWVNQFISSELDWQEKGLHVRQQSQLPRIGKVRLEFTCAEPQELSLQIRRPHWAKRITISVNGEAQDIPSDAGSYESIERTWTNGDVIEIDMPLGLRLESMPDNPARVAAFYGPVLLAGLLDNDTEQIFPVLVTNDLPAEEWLKQSDDGKLVFKTAGVGRPADQTLVPFHGIDDSRYVIYWDLLSESGWEQHQAAYKAERKRQLELEIRTVDLLQTGEMQPERDHNVTGENTSAGEFGGRKFRHAYNGGWFSCEIKLPENQPADLIITYWGSDTGKRSFDILLDGETFASESLNRNKPEKFWDKTYPLPESLTTGKSKPVLRFQAQPENFAGGIYGIRVVRRSE